MSITFARRNFMFALAAVFALTLVAATGRAQQSSSSVDLLAAAAAAGPGTPVKPVPALDLAAINKSADPCDDFYKYACGNYDATHPIPADQASESTFYQVFNLSTDEINGILTKYSKPDPARTPNEQKIGDYYAACLDTAAIDKQGLAPVQPLLDEINKTDKAGLIALAGQLQRIGVNVFFSYGEQQDFKDAAKQIASVDQGGLGLPERDFYFRDGAKDKEIRAKYAAHVAKMLSFAGDPPQLSLKEGADVLAFETLLAKASDTITARRDPASVYHLEPIGKFEATIKPVDFNAFLDAVHSPHVAEINVANTGFMPAMLAAVKETDMATLRAYMRFQVLSTFASELPTVFDNESFQFYGHELSGTEKQRPRWKRCSGAIDGGLGEALGQVYVQQYFSPAAKAETLQMVHDIELAMQQDIQSVDWMSPETKKRAEEKLHAVADKIGYPDKWRDYSSVIITRTDPVADQEHTTAFENDRELNKIGKPVDHGEFNMSPSTVNAYYDPSMNDINFPAGILQPPFFDPHSDLAVKYGHIGAIIGHELTHGFDDQGRQFGPTGNLDDWWTASDAKNYEVRSSCLKDEYGSFKVGTGADAVNVNGKLTLGENTADNGGVNLAYAAFLERAKKDGLDLNKKIDGYTPVQRFYLAYAQDWCDNARPASVRNQVLTDPHSPSQFRADGVIVNQAGFGPAFGCKKGTPMVPEKSCRVW
jgi:predicted metalloendopeptidase